MPANAERQRKCQKQVYSLPLVRLTAEDIIRDAGHMFYKSVSPVYLEENLPLQDPTNTARDVILQRASWQYCKQKGLTKKRIPVCAGVSG